MSARLLAALALLLSGTVLLTVALRAEEGDKTDRKAKEKKRLEDFGPSQVLDLIHEHEKDLGVTDEQDKKLEDLKKKVEGLIDKVRGDEELRELLAKVRQANRNKNNETAQTARERLREKLEQKTGVSDQSLLDDLRQILTAEQVAKLQALRQPDGPNGKAAIKTLRDKKQQEKKQAAEMDKGASLLNGD